MVCALATHADAPAIWLPAQNRPEPQGGGPPWHWVPAHDWFAGQAWRIHCCDDGAPGVVHTNCAPGSAGLQAVPPTGTLLSHVPAGGAAPANAIRSAMLPSNRSRSIAPATPGRLPVALYCQNLRLVSPGGSTVQLAPQL